MSDYTPTTEEVREAAGPYGSVAIERDAFDRWLAERDRQVAEKAWDEGKRAEETAWTHAVAGHPVEEGEMCDECPTDNPYRKE